MNNYIKTFIVPCLLLSVYSGVAQNFPSTGSTTSVITTPVTHSKPFNAQGNTLPGLYNFSKVWTPVVPYTNPSDVTLSNVNVRHQTTYLNGFGQPLEVISYMSDNAHDMATVYDQRPSMEKVSYLPYPIGRDSKFQANPYNDEIAFYQTANPEEQGMSFGLQSHTAQNGLQIASSYQPGAYLTGLRNGTTITQSFNAQSDNIRIWNTDQGVYSPGVFADKMLLKKHTNGQHNAQSDEYYNKDNQLILKTVLADKNVWLKTYYVYNDLGRLILIMPPKAVIALESNGFNFTDDIRDGLCYTYQYNSYGQVITKHTPGQDDNTYSVTDAWHRPVLTQTPLMRDKNKWLFTVYDKYGHVAFTGLYSSTSTSKTLQQTIDAGQSSPGTLFYYLINEFDGDYHQAIANSITDCEVHHINFYDTYNQDPELQNITFTSYPEFLSGPQYVTPDQSKSTWGLLTGTKTLVVGKGLSHDWISTIYFYDIYSRLIQTQTINPFNDNSQLDKSTTQYQFDGKKLQTIDEYVGWSTANKPTTKVVKLYEYDFYNGGRLKDVKINLDNGTSWRSLSDYRYNSLNQVVYKGIGLVEHQYTKYNIRGQLTELNKDFIYDPNCTDHESMTFAEQLAYETGFTKNRLDGGIAGFIWRGSGSRRAYGYNYDNVGRLKSADFNQWEYSPNNVNGYDWGHVNNDYSVSNVTYDPNGNMLTLKQRGVEFGVVQNIDDLNYTYLDNSNQLDNISDNVTTQFPDLFDFTDNNQGAGDYAYDSDGNLSRDNNKNIQISYNFQDLPVLVNASGGTIDNKYAGDGTLLQKTITDGGKSVVYRYWDDLVFRNDSLLYLLTDEGRCRWLADSNKFKFDYFIKDHLGNVRTTVTADLGNTYDYLATHELASANLEHAIFDGMGLVTAPKPGSTDPNDQESAELDGSDPNKRIGTSILLEVMAGDKFNVSAQSFYDNTGDNNVGPDANAMLAAITGTLIGGHGGLNPGESGQNTDIINHLFNPSNYMDIYDQLKENATDPELPRAYLNYIVFDKDMHIVAEKSGAIQVGNAANAWTTLQLTNDISIANNGYLAVYISNEQNKKVWFDNMQITYYRGRLLQENHYYPHGLLIDAGSNTPLPNKFKYQGKELQDDLGLQLYDFHARQYDPQIGRFWGIDPADQFPSGYTGMANDPANNIDPTGMVAGGVRAYGESGSYGESSNLNSLGSDGIATLTDPDQAQESANQKNDEVDAHMEAAGYSPQGNEDPTVYATSDGKVVKDVKDGSNNVVIFDSKNNNMGVALMANMDKILSMGITLGQFSQYANNLGVEYDVSSINNLYLQNQGVAADKVGGVDIKTATNITLDNKPYTPTAEVFANGNLNGNKITVQGPVVTKNDLIFSDPKALTKLSNTVSFAHMHVIAGNGTLQFKIPFGMGSRWSQIILSGGRPSLDDLKTAPAANSRYRDIMVDKSNIYFYNKENIITIPRPKP